MTIFEYWTAPIFEASASSLQQRQLPFGRNRETLLILDEPNNTGENTLTSLVQHSPLDQVARPSQPSDLVEPEHLGPDTPRWNGFSCGRPDQWHQE